MKLSLAPIAFFALAACEKPTPQEAAQDRKEVATAEADNTKKNQRDVDPDVATKTPLEQGENKEDLTITAGIRKDVVADESLSINAKNVKIITNDGVVTLRGTVDSAAEKSTINAVAQKTSGVKRVDNQIEISK